MAKLKSKPVPIRNLRSEILVVQSAQDCKFANQKNFREAGSNRRRRDPTYDILRGHPVACHRHLRRVGANSVSFCGEPYG
jgi:hypothetical protein